MTPDFERRGARPFGLVLGGAFLAATLDIVYACVFWAIKSGVPPSRILQSVAAGVLGPASFEGGTVTAALGLLLHFLIMLAMATTYFVLARRWPPLHERPLLCGAVYGSLLYVIMNFVVVPLSRAGAGSTDLLWTVLTIGVNVLLIGIPIALFTRAALARQ